MTLLLFCLAAIDGNVVLLDAGINTKNLADDHFQVTADGNLLMHDIKNLYAFTPEGKQLLKIVMPEKYLINSFCFVPNLQVYAVSTIKLKDESGPRHRTFFYDEQGHYLGLGYDAEGNELDKAYRQLLVDGDRVFVNIWSPDYGQKTNPAMLTEARLVPFKDGYQFDLFGPNFSPMWEETKQFSQNFKLRWVVEKPGVYDQLFVMNQLQSEVGIYYFASNKINEEEYVALKLKDRVDKAIFPREHDDTRWIFSFSKNTGFYNFEDGFLVGYSVPFANYNFSSDVPWDPDERPFSLYLQPVSMNFEITQHVKKFDQAYLAGVYHDAAYVVEIGSEDHRCRLIRVTF